MKEKSIVKFFLEILIILFALVLIIVYIVNSNNINSLENIKLIGHAFGIIDGIDYTNSLEAFYAAYNRGVRIFEVDLQMTSDGKLVLIHDWELFQKYYGEKIIPTEKVFLETKIFGKYTPLSFEDLFKIMRQYPDIFIVTDSKYLEQDIIKKQFEEIIRISNEKGFKEELDRIIVQIYNENMYKVLNEVYEFKNIIFTLYQRWDGKSLNEFEKICMWCDSNQINQITIWNYLFNKKVYSIAQKYNIDIYVHTENNIKNAKKFLGRGVKGIYTDIISKTDLYN